jgi:hypothetical protein
MLSSKFADFETIIAHKYVNIWVNKPILIEIQEVKYVVYGTVQFSTIQCPEAVRRLER